MSWCFNPSIGLPYISTLLIACCFAILELLFQSLNRASLHFDDALQVFAQCVYQSVSIPQSGFPTFRRTICGSRASFNFWNVCIPISFNPSIGLPYISTYWSISPNNGVNALFQSLNRASLHFDGAVIAAATDYTMFQSLNRASLHFDILIILPALLGLIGFNPSIGLPYISTDALYAMMRETMLSFNPSIGLPYISTSENFWLMEKYATVSIPQSGFPTFRRMPCMQ